MNDLKRSIRKLTAVTLSAAIMAGSAVPLVSYAAEPEKGTLTNCVLAAKEENQADGRELREGKGS